MFERALIYNPAFGTEHDIDPQLVYSWCADDKILPIAEGVRQIGVAQGIVELAHSFGGQPAKYFKSGTGNQTRYTIVVPLLSTDPENWRLGFWFAGQIVLPPDSRWMTPDIVYSLSVQAFNQQKLISGMPPGIDQSKPLVETYWSAYVTSLNAALTNRYAICLLALAPESIRMAPGMLDPSTQQSIDSLRREYRARDVMVLTADEGAAVYAGQHLNLATRRSLQRWLYFQTRSSVPQRTPAHSAEPSPPLSPQTTVKSATPGSETADLASEVTGDPLGEQSPTKQYIDEPNSVDPAPREPPVSSSDPPVTETSRDPPNKSWWWRSFGSIASVSLPSAPFPTVPLSVSLPSVSLPSVSLPSVSLSSVTKVASSSWWSTAHKPERVDGLIIDDAVIYDTETGAKYTVSVWRQALYLYAVVNSDPAAPAQTEELGTLNSKPITKLFDALATNLEGFSFAFAPPTKFYYLINDPDHQKMVCTFPPSESTLDALPPLAAFETVDDPQIVRSGATCLCYTQLPNGIRAVFGKKNRAGSPSTKLLGMFEVDAQQWLEEYVERRILA